MRSTRKLLSVTMLLLLLSVAFTAATMAAPPADRATPGASSEAGDPEQPVVPSGGWMDNFDSYATGSQLHGQGGWKGWDNQIFAGALTSDAYAHSAPNSAEIEGGADLVHEYEGYTSGQWVYTLWQYVPDDFSGGSYLLLLNTYNDGGPYNWSSQVLFESTSGMVISDGTGDMLPLITGEWVEIRVEIDLDADMQSFYYGGDLLYTSSWTDGLSGGGALNIGAVDLYANGASAIYYDDLSLQPMAEELGWMDNFDSYATGSQLHGQGGWKGWDNQIFAGALTSDAYAHSAPNSAEIEGGADLVHEYEGYTSGQWVYTLWQYVPDDFSGGSYLLLLNTYNDGGPYNWSSQVLFESTSGMVISDGTGDMLPLITGEWVEIRVEIDLDADMQSFYYGGDLLYTSSWTDGLSGGGALNIGAVDLYANGASAIYYDDLSLQPFEPVTAVTVGNLSASTDGQGLLFALAPLGLTLLAGVALLRRRAA